MQSDQPRHGAKCEQRPRDVWLGMTASFMTNDQALVRAPEDHFESKHVTRQTHGVHLRTLYGGTTRS